MRVDSVHKFTSCPRRPTPPTRSSCSMRSLSASGGWNIRTRKAPPTPGKVGAWEISQRNRQLKNHQPRNHRRKNCRQKNHKRSKSKTRATRLLKQFATVAGRILLYAPLLYVLREFQR